MKYFMQVLKRPETLKEGLGLAIILAFIIAGFSLPL
jgi:hypothetical protein